MQVSGWWQEGSGVRVGPSQAGAESGPLPAAEPGPEREGTTRGTGDDQTEVGLFSFIGREV